MKCKNCDIELDLVSETCPSCGRRALSLKAESGEFRITGSPVGFIHEGPTDGGDGHFVDHRPASGGRSLSVSDSKGGFKTHLSKTLQVGREGEWWVMKALRKALAKAGQEVETPTDRSAEDDRGEDGLIRVGGQDFIVQIVTFPTDETIWSTLARGEAELSGDRARALELLQETLRHKNRRMAASEKSSVILAIDGRNVSSLFSRELVTAYLKKHGAPEKEFGFAQIWLIGPTVSTTICLGGPDAGPAV